MSPATRRRGRDSDPKPFDPAPTREAIRGSLSETTDEVPEPRYLYVPSRHSQALSLERPLVLGIRGAGKSVWWNALQSAKHRDVVSARVRGLEWERLEIGAGFGRDQRPDDYPDRHTLSNLLRSWQPVDIWRTVVARHVWVEDSPLAALRTWEERTRWVSSHAEQTALAFKRRDADLQTRSRRQLVLFDTLELTARSWDQVLGLLRGLLEVLLDFRGYRALRLKAFVRPDMLDDPRVMGFPEASKVKAGAVELSWTREDLYGLLFQRLGNAPTGEVFRRTTEELGCGTWGRAGDAWEVPRRLRDEEPLQRSIFHGLAWKWMGTDHRRGFPYTWLYSHLVDALDQVSPRSFLAAVREAAERPLPAGWRYCLHYEAIKQGVQRASQIRVDEVKEDFEWIGIVMEPLGGLVIPCHFEEIDRRWKNQRVIAQIQARTGSDSPLPPRHLSMGPAGLRTDLKDLGFFSELSDGRINMPDVYRVAFGLGRRGGVPPVR